MPKDVYRLPVGIRKVEWNNNSVTINGRQMYMRGFGRHEDSAVRPASALNYRGIQFGFYRFSTVVMIMMIIYRTCMFKL